MLDDMYKYEDCPDIEIMIAQLSTDDYVTKSDLIEILDKAIEFDGNVFEAIEWFWKENGFPLETYNDLDRAYDEWQNQTNYSRI